MDSKTVALKAAKRSWTHFGRPFRATKYAPQVSTWLFSRQSLGEDFCDLRLCRVLGSCAENSSGIHRTLLVCHSQLM
jgi:hypothetical protein